MTLPKLTKVQQAWTFYDWANSVYSLVITSTIFPIYFTAITTLSQEANQRSWVYFFGWKLHPDQTLTYSLTASFLIVVFLSPILSSIADVSGKKKWFLQFFCYLGSISCGLLFFLTPEVNIWYGLILNITASVGFWGSLVFYNSYLPEIASKEEQDRLSARGFIMGYIGSVLLMVICLVLIMFVAGESEKGFYTRLSFLLTALWWMGFAQYSFAYLPKGTSNGKVKKNIIRKAFHELLQVQKELFSDRNLRLYLIGFFSYSAGVQTIFLIATLFGTSELQLPSDKLILTILLLQLEAIIGAWIFSRLSQKIGNIAVISIAIFLWIGVCVGAYFIRNEWDFYAIAALVGLTMGGIQSMSRSTYSKLLPKTQDTTTYFSFYDLTEKMAIVLGTFMFGTLAGWMGMRISAISLSVFFIVGFLFIFSVRMKNTKSEIVH